MNVSKIKTYLSISISMKKTLLFLLFLFIFALPALVRAQDAKFTALYIINFTKYVQWPEPPGDEGFVITVLGEDPVTDQLKALASAATGGAKITINKVMSLESVGKTQILFISPDKCNMLGSAASKFSPANTLIVTQKSGLAREGAGINIISLEGKLTFEINTDNLKKSGLSAKPVLFKLGKPVS